MLSALILSAVLASNASGKQLVRVQQGTIVPSYDTSLLAYFPLLVPGCYPTGSAMGTKGQTITVVRAGVATYADASGTIATCQANEARVGCDPTNLSVCGLLVEPARTNYVLNSGTHPKTSESTGSLSTGAHVAWHTGTGTMTVAAGTATVTGLSCTTVAAGTICSFTVTVAGTMALTTTAGTTHAQIENGAYRTSQIATAGTSAARAADAVSIVNPLAATNPASWCVEGTYTPESGRAWGSASNPMLWAAGIIAGSNTLRLFEAGAPPQVRVRVGDAAGAAKAVYVDVSGFAAGSTHRVGAGNTNGSLSLMIDGVYGTIVSSGEPGTGVIGTMPASMVLGGVSGTALEFGGYIQNFKVSRGSCK